jgi:hypothetical protein
MHYLIASPATVPLNYGRNAFMLIFKALPGLRLLVSTIPHRSLIHWLDKLSKVGGDHLTSRIKLARLRNEPAWYLGLLQFCSELCQPETHNGKLCIGDTRIFYGILAHSNSKINVLCEFTLLASLCFNSCCILEVRVSNLGWNTEHRGILVSFISSRKFLNIALKLVTIDSSRTIPNSSVTDHPFVRHNILSYKQCHLISSRCSK